MFILENLKRRFEQVTGRDRPTVRQARSRLVRRRPKTFMFADDGAIPNHSVLPMVFYRRAVRVDGAADPAAIFEELFHANYWDDSWRDGIYDFVHYHSRVHEVLGIARGRARVQFGGPKGMELDVMAGDVAILPPRAGHRCLVAGGNFCVVGGYPPGGPYDECRGRAGEDAARPPTTPPTPLPGPGPL